MPPSNRSIKQVALELALPSELVRHLIILAPIAALNIWPRVHQLLTGAADPSGWPFVGFQILTLVLLSRILFAMERANWLMCVALVGFGLFLVAINLTFSTESIGYIRDAARDHNRTIGDTLDALKGEIEGVKADRAKLPPFTPTTADQVTSALHAVDDARKARVDECGERGEKNGPNCRPAIRPQRSTPKSTRCRRKLTRSARSPQWTLSPSA